MQKSQLICCLATAKYYCSATIGEKMMKVARAIGMSFGRMFCKDDLSSGLVRLFEVEYNREYRNLRKNGVEIDANFVRNYLRTST